MSSPNLAIASASGRYASALFELARESDCLEAISKDMETLASLLSASADLRFALANPDFRQEQKRQALEAVCAKIEAHRLTRNGIGVLAQHGRIGLLGEVASGFASLLARHRKEQHAEVIAAHPLPPSAQAEIQTLIEKAVGGKIRLSAMVDPALLSGVVVKLGSLMIDCSLQTKLTTLAFAMKETK